MPTEEPDRRHEAARALRRHLARLERKREGLLGDLAEARRAGEYRAWGETLLAYLHQVKPRAERTVLPDPADPNRNVEIPLDPRLAPQANAARYFKRAAKGERGLGEVPPRLAAVEAEAHALQVLLERVRGLEDGATDSARPDDPALDRDLERALERLPRRFALPHHARPGASGAARASTSSSRVASDRAVRAPSARLQPRRLRSAEGWDVLIGRNNEGNDYLTHALARPEDYWFHVHGAAGSHVVLRRGKGKNEPSKRTVEEVAGWAAYHSQARTAGKVPVIVTRKKYVRKPRKGPPGLALCTQEKTLMVRPQEPPRDAIPTAEPDTAGGDAGA